MLKTISRTPAYAFALALKDSGVDIDPEDFALAYRHAKGVWKSIHPEDSYYRPSEFYTIYSQDSHAA